MRVRFGLQPDFSNVGNSDLLDRTMRTGNWLRTDTIFIENTQIEALSYRPPWTAAICEVGFTTGNAKERAKLLGDAQKLLAADGVSALAIDPTSGDVYVAGTTAETVSLIAVSTLSLPASSAMRPPQDCSIEVVRLPSPTFESAKPMP